ncbi:uncharacterized protein [Halyomorpha halys]|uniref:uncharacterized protein n=1 Tax=Halyomorpha halys TaxID=286706 RepID=UPI0006D4E55D
MVRPKSSGRCVGVQRCSKILYEMLSRKLVLAVQRAASASIYNRQTTLAELTTAQSVILAIMNSLLTEDLEFCNLLLKLYSSVEQLRSSYLTVWLRDDFDFPEEDVSKVLMTVARLVNGGILDMPDHVLRVFRGLAGKYHVVESCQHEKDFETIKFLIEGESDEGCNEYAVKESTINEKKGSNSITPKITVDGGDLKTAYYSGEEFPKKFVLKNINFKEVAEATKNYGIAKSSSDTNILGRGARNRRKATLSMLIDEKEESTLAHSSGIPYKSGSVTDIPQSHGIHVSRFRRSSIDRYRNAISKKDENTVFEISHSGKRTEVAADNRKSYNISKSSSALNLRSNIADIIEEKSPVTEDKPFYNIYKSSSARCVRSHIAETPTSDLLPSDPVSLFSGIMNYQVEGLQALVDQNQAVAKFKNKLDESNNKKAHKSERILSSIKVGIQSLMDNSALPGFSSFMKSILQRNQVNGLMDNLISTQIPKIKFKEKDEDEEENFFDCSSWMSLHEAAWHGDLKELEELLDKDLDIESEDELNRKPLHHASSNGQLEAVILLLKRGANPSAKDRQQKSPLLLSSSNGHTEVCNTLLENGADVNQRDYIGRSALHHAVDSGSKEVISLLITFGADVNAEDSHGWTPLHRASETGFVGAADVLLSHQGNVIAKDESGRTPLHLAADRGKLKVVELLLEQNPQVIAKDIWGKTALHLAASSGQYNVVKTLLDRGFGVDERDNLGLTALHEAVEGGHLELVQYLISRSTVVSPVDNYGRTPLHRAVATNHLTIVKALLEVVADVVARDRLAQTPLHYAAKNASNDIVSLLIEKGADITLTDSREKTPLHVAAINGNKEIVALLLDHGAKLDVQDNLGRTPLHEAAVYGYLDIISTLISYGANVEDVDDLWKTALHLATTRGNLDMVKLLVKSGACVNSRSLLEATPLASALSDGHTAIAKFLRIVGGTE